MNFNISPIAFYPSRAAQQWRSAFYQRNIAVVTGEDLPPFIINDTPTTAPDTIEIYDPNTDTLINTVSATDILAHTSTVNGVSVNSWIYQGTSSGIWGFTKAGYYYLKIGNYYSDILKFGPVNGDYVKLTYQFFDDIITPDGTLISKYIVYKQLFETDLWHPTYEINEEGKENAGIFYAMQQITKKTCGFSEIVNEAQLDTLNLTRMADNVQIEARTNGVIRNFSTNTFEIKSKWESDDVASIEVTFDLFNIVMKCQQTNVAPEPLPIPVPPPPPSNYRISGTTASNVSSIKLFINYQAVTVAVSGRAFVYTYNDPLTCFCVNTSVPGYSDLNSYGMGKEIETLDFSQSCGLQSCEFFALQAPELTSVNFSGCTFESATCILGICYGTKVKTLSLPDATFDLLEDVMPVPLHSGSYFDTQGECAENPLLETVQMPKAELHYQAKALFKNCPKLTYVSMPRSTFDLTTKSDQMFDNTAMEIWNLPLATFASVTTAKNMFARINDNTPFNIASELSSAVFALSGSGAEGMFEGSKFTSINVSAIDFSSCTSFKNMFKDCANLKTPTMTSGQMTGILSIESMFENCTSLTTGASDLLSGETLASVTIAKNTFKGASGSINLTSTTFAALTNAEGMFYNSTISTIAMAAATFASVTNAKNMFAGCQSLTTINTAVATFASVTDTDGMFYNCKVLTTVDMATGTLPIGISLSQSNVLTVASFTNIADWLKDLSGLSSQKVILNSSAWATWQSDPGQAATCAAALSVAQGKNWTVQH